MKQKNKYFWIILLLILFSGYIISIFNSFFKEDFEYLYDSVSDSLYLITLNQSPIRYEKLKYLNLFNSPKPNNIVDVSLLGTIEAILKKKQLLNDNLDIYTDEMIKDLEKMLDEPIEIWYVYYSISRELNVRKIIPNQLSFLNHHTQGDLPNVFAAEAVIIKNSINEPLEVIKAAKVLIIRGTAASELKNILNDASNF